MNTTSALAITAVFVFNLGALPTSSFVVHPNNFCFNSGHNFSLGSCSRLEFHFDFYFASDFGFNADIYYDFNFDSKSRSISAQLGELETWKQQHWTHSKLERKVLHDDSR